MTESNSDTSTWLPNLVGGVSIWKLAVDLNEPKFFDGRLLVPETEGSESLPVTVRWDLTGLVPLAEARAKWPDDVAASVRDFQAALERVAKVFSTPNSGFDKYKEAFTVPALDADGGASYFYSAEQKKLFVINWGASPRAMGGRAEYVFGYQDWSKVFGAGAGASSAPQIPTALATGENPTLAAAATAAAAAKPKDAEKKDDAKKDEKKARPWWIWPLLALVAIALVLLALFLLRACEETPVVGPDAAADARLDGADDAALDAAEDGAAAADAEADAAAEDAGDGGDASADAGDAGDGAADAAADGGDGGLAMDDGEGDDDDEPGGGGGGGGGGTVVVQTFPGGGGTGARTNVHRRHYHPDAVKWRVTTGTERLARTEQRGGRYDVWLQPGKTFEGVRVEWQDKAGKWHAH